MIAEKQKNGASPVYAYTDGNGFYSLRGLPDGLYTVETGSLGEATGSDKPAKRYLTQYYRERFDRELGERLRISSGSNSTGISRHCWEF